MPGNPLPTIEINASRWPYDENGPVNGKFGEVAVTAAPKAVFDASNGQAPEGMTSGIVQVFNQPSNANRINAEIPNTGGQRGWLFDYPAMPPGTNTSGMEFNYKLLIPQRKVWDYMRIYQPTNLEFTRDWKLLIDDYSTISGWDVGDTITKGGFNGEVTDIRDDGDGSGVLTVNPISSGFPVLVFPNGSTITNSTKGQSATVATNSHVGQNGKFMSLWLDNSYGEANHGGYQNGGMFMGAAPATSARQYDGNGYLLSVNTSNIWKVGENAGENDGGKPVNETQNSNEVYSGGGDSRYDTLLFDTVDNGHFINLVFERCRSTAEDSNDGSYRVWKKVERAGSEYESWTLIWETTNVAVWSPHQDNKFTHGYLFGNKNGSYHEQTDYYLNRWEVWTQKPSFLTEAGV